MAYIGRVPGCGCLVAACVDQPDDPKGTARWVADFIKSGLEVERVDTEVVRCQLQRCTHEDDQLELALVPAEHYSVEPVDVVHVLCKRCPIPLQLEIHHLPFARQATIDGIVRTEYAAPCPNCGQFLRVETQHYRSGVPDGVGETGSE